MQQVQIALGPGITGKLSENWQIGWRVKKQKY